MCYAMLSVFGYRNVYRTIIELFSFVCRLKIIRKPVTWPAIYSPRYEIGRWLGCGKLPTLNTICVNK